MNHAKPALLHSIPRGTHEVPSEFKEQGNRLPLNGEWQDFGIACGMGDVAFLEKRSCNLPQKGQDEKMPFKCLV